jgi:hypothetical protein
MTKKLIVIYFLSKATSTGIVTANEAIWSGQHMNCSALNSSKSFYEHWLSSSAHSCSYECCIIQEACSYIDSNGNSLNI